MCPSSFPIDSALDSADKCPLCRGRLNSFLDWIEVDGCPHCGATVYILYQEGGLVHCRYAVSHSRSEVEAYAKSLGGGFKVMTSKACRTWLKKKGIKFTDPSCNPLFEIG